MTSRAAGKSDAPGARWDIGGTGENGHAWRLGRGDGAPTSSGVCLWSCRVCTKSVHGAPRARASARTGPPTSHGFTHKSRPTR